MQRLEVSGAIRLIYRSLGDKGLTQYILDTNSDPCVALLWEKNSLL